MIKVIGISGVSAAGKTTLTKALAHVLGATAIFWDDYEKISQEPTDYLKWFQSSRNYGEWKYDALANVLRTLKSGKSLICPATGRTLVPTKYIFFEAPLGRKHTQTGQYIDFLIFLNIDADIALARRLLREYRNRSSVDILNELENYLASTRPMYLWAHESKEDADLIVDGNLTLDLQIKSIIDALKQNNNT